MVFRNKGRTVYLTRVTDEFGTARVVSTGTSDRETADDVEALVTRLRRRREWAALNAIVADRVKLAAVYDADRTGTLPALLARLADADLAPMVDRWATTGVPAKYVTQVRRLIPAGARFPVTAFSRRTVRDFLDGLTRLHGVAGDTGQAASNSTKNRYRAALSVFARWLVEREVLETNPVRDVRAQPGRGPRVIYLTLKQARALVAALPVGEQQALEAFMAGSGVELGALLHARRRDLDADERVLHCFPGYRQKPGKSKYRERLAAVTEEWAWAYVAPHVTALPPNARLFTLDEDAAHRAHDRTVKALGLPPVTLHDWRHTYAVACLKRGDDHQDIKRQLGHAPQSTLIYSTYGVYITKPKKRTRPETGSEPSHPVHHPTSQTTSPADA